MSAYAILTNRKRAIIALLHSIVFALIALRGLANASAVHPIWSNYSARLASIALLTIYLAVSSILIQLVRMSRGAREKIYFAFCASSASLACCAPSSAIKICRQASTLDC